MTMLATTLRMLPILLVASASLLPGCNSDSAGQPIVPNDPPASGGGNEVFPRSTKAMSAALATGITTLDVNGVERTAFAPGETIRVRIEVTNRRDTVVTVNHPDPGYPAYCMRGVGTDDCSWHSRFGRSYAAVIVPLELEPFETRQFEVEFFQLANDGMALEPGDYEVKGFIGLDADGDFIATDWHTISVGDSTDG